MNFELKVFYRLAINAIIIATCLGLLIYGILIFVYWYADEVTMPCTTMEFLQKNTDITFVCTTSNHHATHVINHQENKIVFSLLSGGEMPDDEYTITVSQDTRGYKLCYSNDFWEYCHKRVQ